MGARRSIEDVVAYWDRRPCNVKHGRADIDEDPLLYSKQVTARKYLVEPHIPCFAQFHRWNRKRVLDMGCGIGTDSIEFAMDGARVTAMDISEKSVRIAQKRANAECARIMFLRCDMEEAHQGLLVRRKGYYDLVYSFGVIHHTPYPEGALGTARYFLKPDGELRIMLYHRKSTKVARLLWKHRKMLVAGYSPDQIVAWESEAQTGCPITRTYTKKSARELLESCGFTVESMSVEHIFPYRVEDYINHEYVRGFPWNIIKGRFFRWLERQLGWHLCIVARPKQKWGAVVAGKDLGDPDMPFVVIVDANGVPIPPEPNEATWYETPKS